MDSTCLSFIDTTNNTSAVFNRLLSMESSMFTGHTLNEYLSVFVNENMGLGFFSIYTSLSCLKDHLVSSQTAHS